MTDENENQLTEALLIRLGLPADTLIDHAFCLVTYIDPETGDSLYLHTILGDPRISETIGLMEVAKFTMLERLWEDGDLEAEPE